MKRIKCVVELVFIFILPVLFLLPNLSVNRVNDNFVYDVGNNVVSYDSTLTLSYDTSNSIFTVDNAIVEAVDYLGDYLGLDVSNNVVILVLNYTCLWFLMFILWHSLYRVFDWLVHITDKTWLDNEKF